MEAFEPEDPFREARETDGVLRGDFDGERIPMLLRHAEVRDAAKDHATFSSDAPFRVPIPSEEAVRSVRQLPIETDPPDHKEYRRIVEPFFRRALKPEMAQPVSELVGRLLDDALAADRIEAVHDFALPLQSHALALLLKMPPAEGERWIGWGLHVFREGEGEKKGAALENYIHEQLDRAAAAPGDDFFSALVTGRFRDRPLTRDEMVGFANLTFAGGRDTIIHSVSGILAYLAGHPEALDALRGDPKLLPLAAEEFVRVLSPLTHLARRCPVDTEVHGETVPADGRVSLCWAAANYDPEAFEAPDEVRLDRKPNPHLGYGAGPHTCLGAPHARLVIRTLLATLAARVASIDLLQAEPLIERESCYQRRLGLDSLTLRLHPA